MFEYRDLKGNQVQLSFYDDTFTLPIGHVLVVIKKDGRWLLTHHPKRGLEFPGGKIECCESPEEAAIRETFEETGVSIKNVRRFASYVVYDENPFHKAVFTGDILEIKDIPQEFETIGLSWLTDKQLENEINLSFHMKDEGIKKLCKWVNDDELE